jgi:hypothetical protein
VGRLARPFARLDWPVPALLRALEYGAVVLLVGASAATYGLLAVLAYRHYDIVYRERTRGDAPGAWLVRATGGWESRTVLLALASALGQARPVALALTVWLATVLIIEGVGSWRRATTGRDAPTR